MLLIPDYRGWLPPRGRPAVSTRSSGLGKTPMPRAKIPIYSKGPDFNISRAGMIFNLMTLNKK
jgi:hypothetical protein